MKKKLIAFDMYRTCLTIHGEWEVFTFLAKELDLPREEVRAFLLTTKIPLEIKLASMNFSEEKKGRVLSEYNTLIQGRLSSIALFPETIPTLTSLKQQGYQTAVVSNVSVPLLPPITTFLEGYFDYKILSCEVGCMKPQKEIFELLQQVSNIAAEEILMVGDSITSDVGGARNAGIDVLWVKRNPEKEQIDCPTITSLEQVLEFL